MIASGWGIPSAQAGTGNGYRMMSGTSMASPFAAGLALLMRDVNGALSPQGVKDRILQTAIDWGRGGDVTRAGSRGADIDYGAGRLDGFAAIQGGRRDNRSGAVGPGTPPAARGRARGLDGRNLAVLHSFYAYDPAFGGGVFVG